MSPWIFFVEHHAEILEATRHDVLSGGYYLVDYRGYAGYEPGDNVVNIVTMGAIGTCALEASDNACVKTSLGAS